ncbi:AAA family ATPase [Thermosulfurimonas dismutans]|uniref:Chromosome partition protein Smc n=1 Tax=Thermosulfurimonas dismutans TaxID=999894 RepID=A0A179D520_9BACT|nr:AAA family ATPase [Thermosulfurimonas dismutans]OAQ20819.1 Chromosome partition protein smc [Thermosulfurimonas dismutans]
MRIKRLEIYGFKSFPYRVSLPFPPGISAIVGPNGSGKSNIMDALRWVLGEQSLKRLRVRSAEDLLFAGDHGRSPGFAEVRLVLENDGGVPEEFRELPEIVVARRLYRSGESEYLINNRTCRLKDIHYLFLDTGVNPRGYGLIDQGEVGKFLERSPQERRFFLEELAGVSRYRANRDETARNLARTRENLARVEDILSEIRKQITSLEEQAELAAKYLRLRDRLKQLSLSRLAVLYLKARRDRDRAEKNLSELRQNLEALSEREEKLLPLYEKVLSEVNLLKRKLREKDEALQSLESDLKAVAEKLRTLYREENEISKKLERERTRKENFTENLKNLEKELQGLITETEELQKRLETEEHVFKELQERYLAKRTEAEKAEKKLREEEKKVLGLRERLRFLKERKERLDREKRTLEEKRRLLSEKSSKLKAERERLKARQVSLESHLARIEDELSGLRNKKQTLESRVAELKEALRGLENDEKERRLEIRSLEKEKAMLLSLLKQELIIDPEKLKGTGLNLKILAEELEISPERMEAVEAFLGEKLSFPVAESVEDIKQLLSSTELPGLFYKTPETHQRLIQELEELEEEESLERLPTSLPSGKILYFQREKAILFPSGFLLFSGREAPGPLRIKKRLHELEKELQDRGLVLQKVQEEKAGLQKTLKETEEALKGRVKALKKLEEEKGRLIRELKGIEQSLTRLMQEEAFLAREGSAETARQEALAEEKEKIEAEIQGLTAELEEILRQEKELRERRQRLKNESSKEEKAFKEKNLLISELSGRLKALSRRKNELNEELRRTRDKLRNTSQQVRLLEEELQFVRGMIRKEKETRREKETVREGLLREKKEVEAALSEASKRLSELEREGKSLEKDRERLKERLHRLELDLVEAEMSLEHLLREARENHETDLEAFVAEEKPALKDTSGIEEEIIKVREELSQFPPVNLAAGEELEKARERFEFLSSQREELLAAIKDLEAACRRLDEESRRKIREALELANQKLSEVFPLLFEGGRAELYFTDSDDPLQAGLDLKVKLPGKPVRHLSMLSGGEKALCALAVLFAFYLVKPGPFCILDEVDAPLDEANTLRFNELLKRLKEHSQVILVTHNPRVMEIADALFGVTMEEKGVSKVVSVKLT